MSDLSVTFWRKMGKLTLFHVFLRILVNFALFSKSHEETWDIKNSEKQ